MKHSIQQWNKCEIFSIIYNNIRYIYIWLVFLFLQCSLSTRHAIFVQARYNIPVSEMSFFTFISQLKEKLEPPEARSFPPLLQASCQSSWQDALMMLQEGGVGNWRWESCQKRWVLDALDIGITKPENNPIRNEGLNNRQSIHALPSAECW